MRRSVKWEPLSERAEQAGHYRLTAIIVAALVEGACLFAIVVCLIAK